MREMKQDKLLDEENLGKQTEKRFGGDLLVSYLLLPVHKYNEWKFSLILY